MELLLKLFFYLAPMYFANSFAMLLGGKTPLDLGKTLWDKQRVWGGGKTIRGTIAGIATGCAVTWALWFLFPAQATELTPNYLALGFLLSVGAIFGDIVASFFKRRNKIPSGTPVLFLDQLDFVFGGMILGSAYYVPGFFEIVIIAVLTLIIHKASNYFAFKTKLKRVPW
ncbi:MAG: CDP-2,3-bis-(O-geranylgeranyl)-sn-glycerol synthase [archaeon]|nr:CDP-2,3-bis-(O-geranylgeranyl)-sn-glycerol synthase [archaeon]